MSTYFVIGNIIYRDGAPVALALAPQIAQELAVGANTVRGAPTRENAATGRVGGRYGHSGPSSRPPVDVVRQSGRPASTRGDVPKTIPGMPKISIPAPDKPNRRRTESGAKQSLVVHYRRIIGEEAAAARAFEEDVTKMKRDPKVVRYIEAVADLEAAVQRRDQAAVDLGLLTAGEKVR